MDSFRKQLDALMGANRNGDVAEVQRKYYDRELRKEYNEQKKHNYSRDLEECLEKHVLECDRKIQRALKRLDEEDVHAATAICVSEVTRCPQGTEYSKQIKELLKAADDLELEGKTDEKARAMAEIEDLRAKRADIQAALLLEAFNKDRASLQAPPLAPIPYLGLPPDAARTQEMIKEKLSRAEVLGEQGMIDEAQKALEEAEALRKLIPRHESTLQQDVRATDQKLRVCDICGAYLSIYDSDRRLADHFGGKLHLGYMRIRDKLDELREEKEKARILSEEKHRERGGPTDVERVNDRERRTHTHTREKSRERDRGREIRDQSREKDRDRDQSRERDRDRVFVRERSRKRSRSPSRDRIRDRDMSPRDRRSHHRW